MVGTVDSDRKSEAAYREQSRRGALQRKPSSTAKPHVEPPTDEARDPTQEKSKP